MVVVKRLGNTEPSLLEFVDNFDEAHNVEVRLRMSLEAGMSYLVHQSGRPEKGGLYYETSVGWPMKEGEEEGEVGTLHVRRRGAGVDEVGDGWSTRDESMRYRLLRLGDTDV